MTAPLDTQKDIENLQRRSLKEEIFDVLHDKIIAGQVGPGEWLRQEDIATQLGVSMTPVREALDLLVSVGLAERVPYRGVRVPQLTTEEIAEAYAMRLLLEAAGRAQRRFKREQAQVDELKRILSRMKRPALVRGHIGAETVVPSIPPFGGGHRGQQHARPTVRDGDELVPRLDAVRVPVPPY
jgi:DNA-binding GntR family transcriptional regulator